MQNLGNFSGSPYWYHSYARGISADGSVVVGNAWYAYDKSRAFRWTQDGGMQDLGSLGANDESFGLAVSADGSVVVGYNRSAPNSYGRAFRWTQAGGMQDLGVLPNGEWSQAYSTSADGSIVVGSCGFSTGPAKAFIWSQGTGMVDLGAYLSSLLPETAGFNFTYCYDVSSDGNTLVGMGNKSGNRAFIVTGKQIGRAHV